MVAWPPGGFATLTRVKRTPLALAALVVVAATALTGCFNGQGATTTMQASMNSGNGVSATAGSLKIENATLVAGPAGSKTATLTMRITNSGSAPDTLAGVAIGGASAYVTPGSEVIAPNSATSFGFDSKDWVNAYGLDATPATYVPVQLAFATAGLVTISVLVVNPTGYYTGIAPNPATAPTPAASAAAPSAAAPSAAAASPSAS